jgi:hypothetical protein
MGGQPTPPDSEARKIMICGKTPGGGE